SAQIREILISESAWEEMTCLFAPSLSERPEEINSILCEFYVISLIIYSVIMRTIKQRRCMILSYAPPQYKVIILPE
ncbi:hypothetical protein LNT44_15345, partial [Klebsiella pneumoniae]|nr:hypothetical protein [Klebsiella pneumoniae]